MSHMVAALEEKFTEEMQSRHVDDKHGEARRRGEVRERMLDYAVLLIHEGNAGGNVEARLSRVIVRVRSRV